jgi:transposase
MFFREKATSKTPTLQLVETYRNAKGKVSQRLIISLADCCVPDTLRKAVAAELSYRLHGYQRILDDLDPAVVYWTKEVLSRLDRDKKLPGATHLEEKARTPDAPSSVFLNQIEHSEGVELGPYLVLHQAWKSLGLDSVLVEQEFSPEQIATAKISVMNKLVEPCSEHELPNWVRTTALDELLGIRSTGWGEDRFYRISDRLLGIQKDLEIHLRVREQELFNLDRTILLYDLTNTYFEGEAAGNTLAKRGNSKEKRNDCPLISVGIVLDAYGFIVTHKVFTGNASDCRTLLDCVGTLLKNSGVGGKPVIVVDGGIATEENLTKLKEAGYDYIVNGKRQARSQFADDFLKREHFHKVDGRPDDKSKRPVFVRRISHGTETVVLCCSDGRREKEDAIQDSAERKLVDELENLQARIRRDDPRLKLADGGALVNRAIGRITARTTRASRFYTVTFEPQSRELTWEKSQKEWKQDRDLHGCYHLRSTLKLPDQDLWKLYITLTRVEDSFRTLKMDLGLRPIHHQLAERCCAHIWICILAYHLMRWTEYSLKLASYECTWQTLRRRLQTHCYATLEIPDGSGRVHQHRKPGKPNEIQRLVYTQLGIDWSNLPIRRRVFKAKCAKM